MDFLSDSIIKTQCMADDLEVLSQSDEDVKDDAEKKAIAFFKGFLARYDTAAIFDNVTTADAALVMFLVDYFLYTLYAAQPDRLIPEIRIMRKEDVEKWLLNIQKGIISPDFPVVSTDTVDDVYSPFKWGSRTKLNNTW